ncbi:MAG: peptidylprolyl isomerase [Candidatus Marisimplicoccus sp.]|jgi:cyclophilin family peptidyl-prolyl cis-trans isomerase|nr:MAG: peptidylprolyl isomerase [Flavobacteriales bacterium]
MNLFNRFFLVVTIIFFLGCKNNSYNSIETSNIPKNKKTNVTDQINELKEEVKENIILTDENVIDFLFEYEKNNKENHVRIYTPFGEIEILLYDNTPYHRSNFIYLTKKKYFEGTQFYRVINDFVIQAGNSDNIKVSKKRRDIGKYLLPNDFNKGHTHKRGMVSMPSSTVDNPYKMASPFEFFIVQKKDGAHHLNGSYTIFGEVIDGMETVDIIANLPTDNRDWPLNNVYINKVEIVNDN